MEDFTFSDNFKRFAVAGSGTARERLDTGLYLLDAAEDYFDSHGNREYHDIYKPIVKNALDYARCEANEGNFHWAQKSIMFAEEYYEKSRNGLQNP
jgi:hypothetical protein